MNDADNDAQLAQLEQVQEFLKPRIERAERAYSQALTGLWLGNAGAALATLSLIGVLWKGNSFPKVLLLPLGCFVLGIVAMGTGALWTLAREKRAIEQMQSANSILDMKVDYVESPAQRVGLSLYDGRTVTALVAGGCFVFGCVIGFAVLTFWPI
jgi:hypothetical protein